jgi:hypothetical protein
LVVWQKPSVYLQAADAAAHCRPQTLDQPVILSLAHTSYTPGES